MTALVTLPPELEGLNGPPIDSSAVLLERAIDRGASVEMMERLVALHTQMQAKSARETYFHELAAFQRTNAVVAKTKTVRGGNIRYNYAPLDEIVAQIGEALAEHGFSFDFDVAISADGKLLIATCNSHHRAGHTESRTFTVPLETGGRMNAVQQYGSASTYAKRYALVNTYGLVTADEDDDAKNAAPSAPPAWQKKEETSEAATTPATPATPVDAPAPLPPPSAPTVAPTQPASCNPAAGGCSSVVVGATVEQLTEAQHLLAVLKIDKAKEWPAILSHFGLQALKTASSDQAWAVINHLKLLASLRQARAITNHSPEAWAKALAKRNLTTDVLLNPPDVAAMFAKLLDAMTPFDKAKLQGQALPEAAGKALEPDAAA